MDDFSSSQQATVAISVNAPVTPRPNSVSAVSTDEGRFVSGTLIGGRYRVISLLGRGGMGEVYRATDLTLAQPVALKFLSDAGTTSQRMLELFHNEVRVARQVSHPNVCRVYDVGEADGLPYISMEYVDGEDLASLLHRIGRLPAAKALEIARKVCAGVAAAHDKGVIHRDLKPANIMLDRRGHPVVMDFGLAVVAEQLYGQEARNGTPAYMAPEQLRGEEATAKSDLYSLGLLLYELFTGRRAYEATSLAELIQLQESGQVPSMSSIAAEIDPATEAVIARCLQADPKKRPATALSIAAALPGGDFLNDALAAGETPSPDLVAASGKTEGLRPKYSIPLTLGLAVLICAVPFARNNIELHSLTPMELSPDALAAKVRSDAEALGYTAQPVDRKFDLHWNYDWIRDARLEAKNRDALRRFFQAEPPMQLGYRESPLPLNAEPDGEVTEERPAPIISGMLEAWVNTKGELRRLRAAPPQIETAAAPREIDVGLLSRMLGFNLAHWAETTSSYTPLYASDWLKSWRGKHPRLPKLDVTVQASAWRGRITEVEVLWPWSKPDRTAKDRANAGPDMILSILGRITSVLVFLFSAFLAARNLKAGRGDLRGARRLSTAFLILLAVRWLFHAHWVADIGMFTVLTTNAATWVVSAALVWLLYIALEPAVRARWPHALVTWSRVLIGRWRDAQVATHVLYGAAMGLVIVVFFEATQWYFSTYSHAANLTSADVGSSGRLWLVDILGKMTNSTEFGLVIVFAIFCFRVICRKDWIASLAVAVFFSLQEGDVVHGNGIDFLLFLPIFTLLAFTVLRVGLLSTIVALFFINVLFQTPGAQNLSHPYEWAVFLYPALALAIIGWAFWRTSGDQLLAVNSDERARMHAGG